ncbi:MAG: cyclic nucleotide-binding domain-containing protein [Desulfobacterales bacterium]
MMISTIEKVLFLKSVNLFDQIPGEDLARIAEIAKEVSFEKEDYIIKQGESGDCLYLVIEGEVRVIPEDRELVHLGKGECFGEMSLLDSEPRSASVQAITPVVLLKIIQEDFYSMMTERPKIARGVLSVLTRRLRDANKTISELTGKK